MMTGRPQPLCVSPRQLVSTVDDRRVTAECHEGELSSYGGGCRKPAASRGAGEHDHARECDMSVILVEIRSLSTEIKVQVVARGKTAKRGWGLV